MSSGMPVDVRALSHCGHSPRLLATPPPKNFSRGRGNHRGKRGGRGNPRGDVYHSATRPHWEYDNQPQRPPFSRHETRPDSYCDESPYYRYPSSPIRTYNRYSPLRDTHTRRDSYVDPSYTQNPMTYHNQGFHEDRHARKRGPDPRVGAEEGGEYREEKRKRV